MHIIYPRNHFQYICSNDLESCRNFPAILWLCHKMQCLHQPLLIPVKHGTEKVTKSTNGNLWICNSYKWCKLIVLKKQKKKQDEQHLNWNSNSIYNEVTRKLAECQAQVQNYRIDKGTTMLEWTRKQILWYRPFNNRTNRTFGLCYIPSVMAKIRYVDVDQAAGYCRILVGGWWWTLKDWYSQFQSQLLKSRVADLS